MRREPGPRPHTVPAPPPQRTQVLPTQRKQPPIQQSPGPAPRGTLACSPRISGALCGSAPWCCCRQAPPRKKRSHPATSPCRATPSPTSAGGSFLPQAAAVTSALLGQDPIPPVPACVLRGPLSVPSHSPLLDSGLTLIQDDLTLRPFAGLRLHRPFFQRGHPHRLPGTHLLGPLSTPALDVSRVALLLGFLLWKQRVVHGPSPAFREESHQQGTGKCLLILRGFAICPACDRLC